MTAFAEHHTRWRVLLVLVAARLALAYQFQSVASTGPLLVDRLGLSYAAVGTLIGIYMLPGIVVSIPGGSLTARFGDRRICAFGLGLMAAGGLTMALAEGPFLVFGGRLVSGTGAVLFNLVVMKMATDWFAGREIAVAMGAMLASWPGGIALGLLTQPRMAAQFGWAAPFVIAAAAALAAVILMAALYRDAPSSPEPAGPASSREQLAPGNAASALIAGLLWGVFNVGLVVFFSFTPPLLVERGLKLVDAASVTSLALWISMASLPFGGAAVTAIGRPRLAIILFSLLTGTAAALLPALDAAILLSALYGLFLGPPASAIMALPARALPPAQRARGFGVFYTAYYTAMSAGPALGGVLRDLFSTAAAPTWYGALLFAICPLLLATFDATLRRVSTARADSTLINRP